MYHATEKAKATPYPQDDRLNPMGGLEDKEASQQCLENQGIPVKRTS